MTTQVNGSSSGTAPNQPACGLLRTVALAGIGLISMLGDRLEAAYERGAQREGQKEPAAGSRGAGVSRLVFDEWETTLARLNLPTKSDIDALAQQMTALQEQIDQIAAQRAANHSEE